MLVDPIPLLWIALQNLITSAGGHKVAYVISYLEMGSWEDGVWAASERKEGAQRNQRQGKLQKREEEPYEFPSEDVKAPASAWLWNTKSQAGTSHLRVSHTPILASSRLCLAAAHPDPQPSPGFPSVLESITGWDSEDISEYKARWKVHSYKWGSQGQAVLGASVVT